MRSSKEPSHDKIPVLPATLARLYPGHAVYVLGGYALWQWAEGDWTPGDVDVFITGVGAARLVGEDFVNKRQIYRGDPAAEDIRRSCEEYGYAMNMTPQSEIPAHVYPLARTRWHEAMANTRRQTNRYADFRALVPYQTTAGDPNQYDVFSTHVSDIAGMMTDSFDLNVCAVGYQVVVWNMWQAFGGLRAFYASVIRLGYEFPPDIRRLVGYYVMETQPQPKVSRRWIYGAQFDPAAARREPGRYAIIRWQCCSLPEKSSLTTLMVQGIGRIDKYTRRGFLVAEAPSRTEIPIYPKVCNAAAYHMAEKVYRERKRQCRDDDIRELMREGAGMK